jgi:hypothetical protein
MGLPILVHGRRFFVSRSRLPDKEAKRPPPTSCPAKPNKAAYGRNQQFSVKLLYNRATAQLSYLRSDDRGRADV